MAPGQPNPRLQPHRQSQRPSHPLLPGHFQQLLGVLVGAGLAYVVTRHLAALPSTFLTALLLAGGSILSGRHLTPWRWWAVLGASCGGLLGSAMVVGQKIQSTHPHEGLQFRLGIVACLMVAGAIGGGSLSRDANHPDRRPPKDTLRSASALCTGSNPFGRVIVGAVSQPATHPVVASDKLFYWLFQQRAERLQPLVASLLPQMEGYVFSAPVLKEREYRLDGLFLPPVDQPELPTLILEAQMAADPDFLLRLNAETGCLLQQQQRQGRPIRQWQVVVICPSRQLNFGDPTPVQEFVQRRVVWIELQSERLPPAAPPLQRALGMLLLPEAQLPACSAVVRAEAAGTSLETEIDDVIAAILVSRFSGRTVPEICAMGGITVEDFSSSVAYREIFGLGRQEGRQEGRQAEAAELVLRLLQRRCGSLNPNQQARIEALPLRALEALADALLDFQGPEDLKAWLSGHGS